MLTAFSLKILYKSLQKYFAFTKGKYGKAELFLTFGGAGHLKPASGTWGSLAAIPFALFIHFVWGAAGLLVAAILLYAASMAVIHFHEKGTGEHDASYIVIDEVIGMLITLTMASLTFTSYALAFILFRAFDALKPGPIGWVDKNMPGAHGVLLDDVLAGIAAAICVSLLQIFVN